MKKICSISEQGVKALNDGESYVVVYDIETNEWYIADNGESSQDQVVMAKFKKSFDCEDVNKAARELCFDIKQAVEKNKRTICYTALKNKYGKRFADSLKPYRTTENPRHTNGKPMKLYLEKVVDYIYRTGTNLQ